MYEGLVMIHEGGPVAYDCIKRTLSFIVIYIYGGGGRSRGITMRKVKTEGKCYS